MKETIAELADTTSTSVRGSSITQYALEPTQWLKEIVDAAKKRHFFLQVAYQTTVPVGAIDVVIPYRKNYMKNTGTFADQTAEGSAVSYTALDNLEGKQLTPTQHAYGVAISDYALRVNAVDLIRVAKEELVYNAGDVVDAAVAAALRAAGTSTSSAAGAQELFGGDASSCATIAAGDILTTDLVADGKQRLMSTACKYWSAGTEGTSSAGKNPWLNDTSEPYVLFIAPEGENAFLKDSQFVNAAEYGGRETIMNGEIGKYLGIKIVVTPNCPKSGDGDYCLTTDWGSATNIKGHMNLMVKARKCVAFAYGREPTLNAFPYQRELETDIQLVMDYATSAFYTDAIVKIYTADA